MTFAYQQPVANPFSIKFQQSSGKFNYSISNCKNSISECYKSI